MVVLTELVEPSLREPEELEDPEFKWIKKRGVGGKNKDVQFYESFTYDGVEYVLYDCVYMYKKGESAPYIGKLVKIWETGERIKKVKVHWFFRPSEISPYLKDATVLENELFFASGDGQGLANLNQLEAIAGKCNVLCTSADCRNPQPSAIELQKADYVFYRTFDVKSCTISDQIGDKVGGLEVNFVFNRRKDAGTLQGPRLDAGERTELNVAAFKEKQELAGNNSPQQFNNTKLNKIVNPALEEESTHAMQVPAKDGSLNEADFSVNPSKNKEITCTGLEEESTGGAKNIGNTISEKKDKSKDINVPVIQALVGKGVKQARKSCDLDDVPSKKAKFDGSVLLDSNGVLGVKDSVGCKKDLKLCDNSSPTNEKLSTTSVSLPKDASRSRQAKDDVGLQKSSKPNGNEKTNSISSSEKEKLTSIHRKDSCVAQKDKANGRSLSSYGENTSMVNVVSLDATHRSSTSIVSPKETLKSAVSKELEGSRQVAKASQCLSTSMKRPLEISAKKPQEKVNLGHDKTHENTNNNAQKPKKDSVVETKNLSKIATSHNNNGKLRIGEEPSKEIRERNHVGDDEEKLKLRKAPLKDFHKKNDGKLCNDDLHNASTKPKVIGHDILHGKVGSKIIEVTRRPHEKATWIKLSWVEQLKNAHDQGRLVLLQNLNPDYTSGEVEDIVWHVFKESCTARMLPHTAVSNPYFGQALVVFKTRDAAEKVVCELDDGCLMLPNQRPLIASLAVLPKLFEKQTTCVGHLAIDKNRQQMHKSMKDAVSTSHCSQPNTIEFEMALEWALLQAQSNKWWKNLYELQQKELKKQTENLKSK